MGLNYHRWSVCRSAVECGRKLGTPIYQSLKEPITRAFGEEFYTRLEEAAQLIKEQEK